jgi:hypothetical protein
MKAVAVAVVIVLGAGAAAFAQSGAAQPAPPARADAPRPAVQPATTSQPAAPAGGAAPASQPAKHRPVQEVLDRRVPEIKFEKAPLDEVLRWVEQYTGALVYVRWAVLADAGIDRDTPVTIAARDRKLSQVLWVIMNEATGTSGVTLAYEASDELFLFSTHKDLSRSLVVKVYDVADITVDVPNFGPGGQRTVHRTRVHRTPQARPDVGPGDGQTRGSATPRPSPEIVTDDEKLQELMELIQCTVAPETWEVNGGEGTIFPYKGKLVIRASLYVHQMLERTRKGKK